VVLLLLAAGVAFALGEIVEASAILMVIVFNSIIGFITEWRAEQALAALQKQIVAVAHVIRNGEEHEVPAAALVPGDLVILAAGGRVPADGRVIESMRLQVQEAALTGESLPVSKTVEPIPDANLPLGDRTNMAYMGTVVTDGRGRLIVVATGMHTEMGKIGALLEEPVSEETPLEHKLAQLGRALIGIVLLLTAVIVTAGYLRGTNFLYMLEVGISLAIAAVPEGLPAVATMTLAIGVQRMSKMRALVRRLPAVETLGSTTVICTDKTGTLTQNEMTVRVLALDGRTIEVSGSGYALAGSFRLHGSIIDPQTDTQLELLLRIGALCNDAAIDRHNEPVAVLGDPTEGALLIAAIKAGFDPERMADEYERIGEIPFDSETRCMVTIHRTPAGRAMAYLKGAPAVALERSMQQHTRAGVRPLTDADRQAWLQKNQELAGTALRVLGLAYRQLPEAYDDSSLAQDFTFVGLVGMMDPLREEAKTAIDNSRQAGIRVLMLTGDQPSTAAEIARQLGIDRDPHGRVLETVHARDLNGLDATAWQHIATHAAVFARVSPEHKLRLVEALQGQGHIVAMTGDGVNDAPALKKADIGVAMGIKGTEVAKETADMIITDDNFSTLVKAVEQGRIIYANILKFIHYLFSCNFSEILTVFVALMVGWPVPLAPLQILWLNLITDVFPALALALEPSAPNVMQRPPRDPQEKLLNLRFAWLISWQGLLLAAVTLAAFWLGLRWYGAEGTGLRHASTVVFTTLVLAQVFHAFNTRSQEESAFTKRLFTNGWLWAAVVVCVLLQFAAVYLPLLQRVLHTAPLTFSDWSIVTGFSLATVAVVELVKAMRRQT
jgi:Ca2+-transporting ATPase